MGSGKHPLRALPRGSGGICLFTTLLLVLNCNVTAGLLWTPTSTADDCDDLCASFGASDAFNMPMVAINGGDAAQALCSVEPSSFSVTGTQFGHHAAGDTSTPPLPCTYYDGSAVVTNSFADGYWCACVLAPAVDRYSWGTTSECYANGFPTHYDICRGTASSAYGFAMGWVQAGTGMAVSAPGSRHLLETIVIMETTHMARPAAASIGGRRVAPMASDICMTAKGPISLTSNFQYLCEKKLASCPGKPPNPPHPGEETVSWPDSCVGSEDALLCKATCSNGVTVIAVCNNGMWSSVVNHCPTLVSTSCNSLPQSPPEASWPSSCYGAADGAPCPGHCPDGTTITAICNKGAWSVSGSCATSTPGNTVTMA
jgi:hypothetical protein